MTATRPWPNSPTVTSGRSSPFSTTVAPSLGVSFCTVEARPSPAGSRPAVTKCATPRLTLRETYCGSPALKLTGSASASGRLKPLLLASVLPPAKNTSPVPE